MIDHELVIMEENRKLTIRETVESFNEIFSKVFPSADTDGDFLSTNNPIYTHSICGNMHVTKTESDVREMKASSENSNASGCDNISRGY